jgi:LAO/AO transport system ATPase
MGTQTTSRIVLAKIGLDGHDRGIKVVARGLRDAGFHVIYAGLWQSLEAVVRTVGDEDAGWLGLSLLSGAHMTLVPQLLEMMQQASLGHVGMLVGGIIPEDDARRLIQLGVKRVFGPGTALDEIAEFIRKQETREQEQPRALGETDNRRTLSRLLTRAAREDSKKMIRGELAALTEVSPESRLQEAAHGLTSPPRGEVGRRPGEGTAPTTLPRAEPPIRIERHPGAVADPAPGPTRVIAVTGSGGVGKSTLIGKLVEVIRGDGQAVAVLACDPQSPLTGGALLGDRIRMPNRPDDDAVFIRSLATPGGRSGVAPNVELMVELFGRFGFDNVIVETVGAGQGDTAIRDVAGVVVVLVQPETGDELQWEKAGQLEIADIVVVHKADLPTADRTLAQLSELLNLPGCRPVPVLRVSSNKGIGVNELWAAIKACADRRHRAAN